MISVLKIIFVIKQFFTQDKCMYAYRQSQHIGEISRRAALYSFKSILSGQGDLQKIRNLSMIDTNPLIGSELERQFLEALNRLGSANREVTVHITGYKYGTVIDPEDGSASQNEGLKVEVPAEDSEMQELLDSLDRNWHITGSYSTAARYTKYMDFSDAAPLDFTIIGKFGRCDSDGKLMLEKQ